MVAVSSISMYCGGRRGKVSWVGKTVLGINKWSRDYVASFNCYSALHVGWFSAEMGNRQLVDVIM